MKQILCFAVATIAIGLMTPAAHAQRSDLDLRFHAPFPFRVGDNAFAAGDYMVTRLGHLKLIFFNQKNRTAASVSVLPASSHNLSERIRQDRVPSLRQPIFPRHCIRRVTGLNVWRVHLERETQLANASPQKPVTTVSVVPSRGALQATVSPEK